MFIIKKNIVYIFIFIVSLFSNAQEIDLTFKIVDYDENFPQSNISKILQSKKGFIWLGTDNGLVRYDGYDFVRYYTNNKENGTISNNYIHDIYEDKDENLWIGTSHGVNLYNKYTDSFNIIDVPPVKGGRNYISSFTEDEKGNLWIGTFGGVKKLNKEKNVLENIFTKSNAILSKGKILSLFYDKEFGVLVGTSSGLLSFDPITGAKRELPKIIDENKSFLKEKILKTVRDDNGDIWFATENNGTFFLSKEHDKFINYSNNLDDEKSISSNNVKDVLSFDKNTIWFATDNGLSVFKKDKEEFVKYKNNPLISSSISDNNIKCLLKDREGGIWLGTRKGSINYFNKANTIFTNIGENIYNNFGLNNTEVNTVIDGGNETLWVGTNGGGLNYLDFKTKESSSYLINSYNGRNIITTIVDRNDTSLLCGTLFGVYEFNKKSKNFNKLPIHKNEKKISSLLIDNEDIWIGTDGDGLIKVNNKGETKAFKKSSNKNSISDNYITSIENRKNGLWVSTQFGLNFFDKKTEKFTNILQGKDNSSLSNNTLTTMYTDSKNRLWVGMGYGGLNYFDENTKKSYLIDEAMGLTDGAINSISEDSKGNLWISSSNLLFRMKIRTFTTPFKKENLEITSFGSKDGIAVKNYSNNCSVKLLSNKLVFGGNRGLTIFNAKAIVLPETKNKIVLTKLLINNEEVNFSKENSILKKDISEASEINLNYKQKNIYFEFSALSFVNTKKNKYAYRLKGGFKNDDWHNLDIQNKLNLGDLDTGVCAFELNSIDANGKLGEHIKTLKIKISPPWWKTVWAYSIYFILVLIVLRLIISFIKSKVIIKQKLLSKQLESKRQAELYKMKLDFFTNISHEIRTPLTLIKGPVDELLESCTENTNLESKLITIKKNSDRLLTLINELLDFRKVESKQKKIYCKEQDIIQFCFDIYESFKGLSVQKNIDYKFGMNVKSIPIYFDKNQMEKVIYNLLSNAFKFTKKKGKIVLLIEEVEGDEEYVQIKIKDNGIGIPKGSIKDVFKNFFQVDERGRKNAGSGIGLALSKTIVELHHGELIVENEIDTWANTVFKISLKKGKDHFNKSQILENIIAVEEVNVTKEIGDLQLYKEESLIVDEEEFEEEYNDNKQTILIIDDHEEITAFIVDVLKGDYDTVAFLSANEALVFMEKQIPDLIICDVMMPEMDGFEFCKIIKTSESTNHIPVVLLTAKASVKSEIEGLSIGADAYITKPFSVSLLRLNIINLLSSKEILRQKYSGRFIVDSNLDKLDVPEEVFINKLMNIIEVNIENSNFDVKTLVDEIGMSRTVLYKKVKILTNHSVASLIKHVRLKKAADILLNTNYPISEVTYLVGFSDRKHFSKEFKKVFNVSPTDYKKSKAVNNE